MSNCSAYWNFLFTARIPPCPVRLSRPQLPALPGVHSQGLYPAPWQCFAVTVDPARFWGHKNAFVTANIYAHSLQTHRAAIADSVSKRMQRMAA